MTTSSTARRVRRLAAASGAVVVTAASVAMTCAPAHADAHAAAGPQGLHAYIVDARTPALTAQAASAATRAGGRVVQSWPQIGVVVVQSTRPTFLRNLSAQHSNAVLMAGDSRNQPVSEGVAAAGSVPVTQVTQRTGTDRRLAGRADALVQHETHLRTIGAIAANRRTEGNSRVVVGVLDGGFDASHPDLRANVDTADSVNCTAGGRPDTHPHDWQGGDHGTHVAGTIAGVQQGTGIQGVAPHVRVASVKVVTPSDTTWPEYLVCGYMWSGLKHFAVTNASLNVYDLWCGDQHLGGAGILAVRRAISFATARNVVHVQSAGNDGLDLHDQLGGACVDPLTNRPDVVQVSAVDASHHLLEFSNTGMDQVDIAAPGYEIWSSLPHGRFGALTGTSQAAPQVAGAFALLASEHPGATASRLVAGLEARTTPLRCGADDFSCTSRGQRTSYYGAGLLNVKAAIVPTHGTATVPLISR